MEKALIEYVVNALWQIPLVASGGWLLIRALKASPGTQHYIWLAVLACAVLLPARGISRSNGNVVASEQLSTTAALSPETVSEAAVTEPTPAPTSSSRWPRLPARIGNVRLSATSAHIVTVVYLGLVLFGLARLTYGWHAARKLVNDSRPISPNAQALLQRKLESIQPIRGGRTKLPEIRQSDAVLSPVVVGFLSPVILLPRNFARNSDEEVRAALCHEMAHMRRHDYLANLVCELASLPVSWHPITRAVEQRIRHTREMICDAIAAREMCSEASYARCLVALAQRMIVVSHLAERAQAVGLFSRNTLEERVMRLMERQSVMSVRAKLSRFVCGVTGMASAVVIAAIFHVTPTMAAPQSPDAIQNAQVAPSAPPMDPVPALPSAAPALPQKPNAQHLAQSKQDATPGMTPSRQRELASEELRSLQNPASPAPLNETDAANIAEFKRQMADITAQVNSPEFKKHIAEIQQQAHELALHNKELQKQLATLHNEEMKKQMEFLHSEQFQKQIAEARKAADQEMAADFKARNEEIKHQMAELQKQLQSGEFKQQMENAKHALEQLRQEQLKIQPQQ